ncbi:hypothetical protein PoB_004244000 [Plakobranchus ocellatus]|uniref:Uncharacterized protein n=1 Tax=Plakobranchus ocellatus TaxID=259542 RepID=A0AAV4B8W0_9GAST|nr:hypothetical protein PoB_004244000 [Plakobranchus ocellatus]
MDEHYVAANKFGPDYYMARFTMDCSTTKDGYFDVLVFDRDGPETYVEIGICVDPPYRTKRLAHVARCGHVNVFYHNRFRCMNYPLN